MVPPPTPNSPLKAPAAGGDRGEAQHAVTTSRGILRPVSAHTSDALGEALAPLTADPSRAAVFCDIDGVLAPIVARAEDAQVRAGDGACCWAGWRAATPAWRASPAARRPRRGGWSGSAASPTPARTAPSCSSPGPPARATNPAFKSWEGRVKQFVADARRSGPAPAAGADRGQGADRGAALARRARRGGGARARRASWPARPRQAGLATHWGRKVLELRPPVPFDKGQAVRELVELPAARARCSAATTRPTWTPSTRSTALVEEGALDAARPRRRALGRGAGRDRRARRPGRGRRRRASRGVLAVLAES